jgi:hypothetical protein
VPKHDYLNVSNGKMTEEQAWRSTEQDEPMAAADIGRVIYACCGGIYAILCAPAIGARGYPPIDPGWTAATFLWVAAIPISKVIDNRPFEKRFKDLAFYCLATAFLDAGTMGGIVPRQVSLAAMLLGTVVYGPIHLFVGILIEGMSQSILTATRPIFKWLTVLAVVLPTCAFPFVFRACRIADLRHRGRTQAELDWNAVRAEMVVEHMDWSNDVTHRFDPATGLKIHQRGYLSEYSLAYQARVAALLAERGIPEWSMKKYLPADDDLIAMLISAQMERVYSFPHDANDNIVLIRGGTVTRWNTTFSNMSDYLAIATPQGLIDIGTSWGQWSPSTEHSHVRLSCGGDNNTGVTPNAPVFVGRMSKYPEVVFVRSGTDWVGAFYENGELLSSASRKELSIGASIMER